MNPHLTKELWPVPRFPSATRCQVGDGPRLGDGNGTDFDLDVIPEESRVNSISGSKPRPRKVRFLVKFEEDAKEKSGDIRHETENLVKNPVDGVDGVDGVAGEAVEAGEEVRHEPAAPRLPSEEAGVRCCLVIFLFPIC